MSEHSAVLNESSQANYLSNLTNLTNLGPLSHPSRLTKLNGEETIENEAINQRNEMKNSDSEQPTKLNAMTKNLFTVDSLLKSAGNHGNCADGKRHEHAGEQAKEEKTSSDGQQFDEEKSMKSDSEELNVDKEDDDESFSDQNGDNRFAKHSESNQQADRSQPPSSSPIKNDFKSIEELYKSSLIQSNQLNGQSNQAPNQFGGKPPNNSPLLPSPSSAFLSNLSFPNHNPHFQALLASHLAPYSAFNAAFNSNPLYLNNLIHQGNLENAAACQQAAQQQAVAAAAASQHPLQQSSRLSPMVPKPPGPPSSGYSAVLEDNLRQALLAAQSNSVNPDTTTSKHGHSLNLISSSFNNHSGAFLLINNHERRFAFSAVAFSVVAFSTVAGWLIRHFS